MTVSKLIQLAQRRIARLEQDRVSADLTGDTDAMERIDSEIAETQTTLNQLQTLPE
jgi:hypothetical protein